MGNFVDVAGLAETPPGVANSATVDGKNIAIFNVDGVVRALQDLCLHRGFPLSNGVIEGGAVRCPAHGWTYDLATGALVNSPTMSVKVYPTKVVDGRILVDVG